jgi:AraC-like DNA-binding protein
MKVYGIGDHLSCSCYYFSQEPLIQLSEAEKKKNVITSKTNQILYLVEGEVSYLSDDNSIRRLVAGDLLFLCGGSEFSFTASAPSKIFTLCVDSHTYMCPKYNIGDLYHSKESMQDIKGENFYPLHANDRICYFLEGLLYILEDGLKCCSYLVGESRKLFLLLLLAYYPKDELYRFFYPILSPDMEFSDYVRANVIGAGNIVTLAKQMNMTVSQFARKFNRVFGENPREWVTKEKAKRIYRDVCDPAIQLKEISVRYGYSDQANFVRFFKRVFGMTPSQLRKMSLATNDNHPVEL